MTAAIFDLNHHAIVGADTSCVKCGQAAAPYWCAGKGSYWVAGWPRSCDRKGTPEHLHHHCPCGYK